MSIRVGSNRLHSAKVKAGCGANMTDAMQPHSSGGSLQRMNVVRFCGAVGMLFGLTSGASAMFDLVMISAMHGVVVQQGKPVVDATVTRECVWGWNDKRVGDQARTNSRGEFDFPELTAASMFARMLPHEPFVKQTVLIRHAGQTYAAWVYLRRDYDANTELNGKAISLLCDLDSQPGRKGDVYGICAVG